MPGSTASTLAGRRSFTCRYVIRLHWAGLIAQVADPANDVAGTHRRRIVFHLPCTDGCSTVHAHQMSPMPGRQRRSTSALLVMRLTEAKATPGVSQRAFSMAELQVAQVMPPTLRRRLLASPLPRTFASKPRFSTA